MTGDIVVEAVGLGYDYVSPPVCALRGVSFELRRGAFLAVMGPNGSGKSTLVRAVLGLLRPTRGSIRVAGREAWEYRREIQRIIGYVPQHDSVNQHLPMCPRDIVGLAASTRGVGRGGHGNLTARVNDALAMVGMADLAHRPFGSLSGGQQQRVLVARALVVDPHLLLMDESFAGVDVVHRNELVELLAWLSREKHVTVMAVVHNINPLAHFVDHVLLLDNRMVAFGTPGETLTPELLAEAYGAEVPVLVCDDGVLHPITDHAADH